MAFLQPGLGCLLGKLLGDKFPQRAMRPVLIVIDLPRFDLPPPIVEGREHLRIQVLVSEAAVEALNHRIPFGFPRAG